MAWLVDDVVCDFAAIYGIRIDPEVGDFAGLSGPLFLRMASRLPVYKGAVHTRVLMLDRDGSPSPREPARSGSQMLDATPLMLGTHPLLREFTEYSTVPAGT